MDIQAIKEFLFALDAKNLARFLIINLLLCWAWIFLCLRLDREAPEPRKQIIRTFFWGGLMVFPALLIAGPLTNLISNLSWLSWGIKIIVLSFLIDGLIEEFIKYSILIDKIYPKKFFDEPRDGLIYGMVIGVGFSFLESFFYGLTIIGMPHALLIIVMRGVITTFMHLLAGGIIGYHLGLAKFGAKYQQNQSRRKRIILQGFVFAIIFHALYNLVIRFNVFWLMIPLAIFLIVIYIIILLGIRRTQALFRNHTL